eukprot:1137170-Pelagomonas_calceolata.AAC.1
MGIWRVTGSTQLQILAVRSICVFNCMSSGNKLVGILNRVGMKEKKRLRKPCPAACIKERSSN